ncbi:MAG TPA: Wzz/FepE/Etk N-terminal domain-containing protein [Solirubrobacteraceae bacterium]|nr:Wzz/FepE/Etk N-terminal domain-containing protein [Solirubrobacteraceae bacterium]
MNESPTDAASLFDPLWKRKWLILVVAILVAAATYEYYKRETPTYSASTQLYLGGTSEQQANGSSKSGLSARALQNQVGVLNSPLISEVVKKRLHAEHNRLAARGKSKIKASTSADFITIATTAHSPRAAADLANTIARVYIARERANYLRNVKTEINNDRQQLTTLELTSLSAAKSKSGKSSGSASTLQAANLQNKIGELESSLSTFAGVEQVSPAKPALAPTSPAPKKNAIFGFVLGLLLASVAAYALSRMDRRLRTLSEVEGVFGTEILVALPSVRAPVKRPDGRRAPAKQLLEPLRRLQTTLHLGHTIDGARPSGPRVILFISADAGDGKSSLIANLARVQSEGGQRVAVIDADFRRPAQARLLDVEAPRGLADVLAGAVPLTAAMQPVPASSPAAARSEPLADPASVSTAVEPAGQGSISALVGGGEVANPPALLESEGMRELLRSLAEEYDYVLIDAPPPLEVSDAMPLLGLVDGIVVVTRIGHTRRVSALRLAQLLGRTASAPVLGAVGNCVPRKDIERYGFVWAPTVRGGRRKLSDR